MIVARFLTAILVVPVLIGMTFDDGWLFRAGIFATGLLGTWEVLWMARQADHRPLGFLIQQRVRFAWVFLVMF